MSLSNGMNFFWPQMTFRGQKSMSNPKNFEVEYLKNGTR